MGSLRIADVLRHGPRPLLSKGNKGFVCNSFQASLKVNGPLSSAARAVVH